VSIAYSPDDTSDYGAAVEKQATERGKLKDSEEKLSQCHSVDRKSDMN
jgi:hypothetical protein